MLWWDLSVYVGNFPVARIPLFFFCLFCGNSSNAHSKKLVWMLCPQPPPDAPFRPLHSTKKPSRMRCGAPPLTNRIWRDRRVVESCDETSWEKKQSKQRIYWHKVHLFKLFSPFKCFAPSGKCLSKCTRWNLRRQMYHKRFKGRHKTKLGFNRCLPGGTEKTTKALQRQHLGGARAKNTAQLQNSCANQEACMYISAHRIKTNRAPNNCHRWTQSNFSLTWAQCSHTCWCKHGMPTSPKSPLTSQQLTSFSTAFTNYAQCNGFRQDPHVSAGQALQGEDMKLST